MKNIECEIKSQLPRRLTTWGVGAGGREGSMLLGVIVIVCNMYVRPYVHGNYTTTQPRNRSTAYLM